MARILVIDDDISVRQLLADFLEARGHTVSAVQSGAQGIQHVDLRRPDAIILDLMLPGITGVEVAKRLRLDPDTRDIPILTVTGVDGTEDLVDILMVDAVVSKPFSLETVESELNRLLNERPSQELDEPTASASQSAPGE